MDIKVQFLGAAGSVTGSRYLITAGDFRFLFDCGLFQGLKELRLRNWDPIPVDVHSIDAVIISHAHIDHCGYLPKLVREGYKGPVYCTTATAELMEIMLLDSAKLQEEEAEFAVRKGFSKHAVPEALYSQEDAKNVFPLFKTFDYNMPFKIHPAVEVVYRDAGHLLGSAITEIFIQGDSQRKKIVFSGDVGRNVQELLHAPAKIENADILFIESTYGNRSNPSKDPSEFLEKVVNDAFSRGGVLLIPAFAVGRTQTLLYYFNKLMREKRIPDVPVYVDSPMAISATYLFYKYPQYMKVDPGETTFAHQMETNMLVFVKTAEHSKSLNDIKNNAVIISSSGMMTGGRIVHHLFNRLGNENDTVLISGYQAEGTRGRALQDHAATIRMFGKDVPVRCKVEQMSSLSGHADREELFEWMSHFKAAPKMVFTVHGEGSDLEMYGQNIRKRFGWNVIKPGYLDTVLLFEKI